MKIDILNPDRFVEVNECPEVTNPIFLDATRHPTSDGVFSYELFGLSGSYDRKTIFGYINLKKPFLHPIVYKMITSMDKKIIKLIEGTLYCKVNKSGELIEDEENGETGLSFLYKNWDNIKFKKTDSRIREEKMDLISGLKKNEAFCTKWLVIPPFYRDINLAKAQSGVVSSDEINDLYSKLINAVSNIDENNIFDFMGAMTENRVQLILLEIYNELVQTLAKKRGLIQENLLGKSIDYATRSVISAPRFTSETWDKQNVKFTHIGVPLAQVCNIFYPFFLREIRVFLEEEFSTVNFIYAANNEKEKNLKPQDIDLSKFRKIYLKRPMEDYTPENIKLLLNLFIKSPEDRFRVLTVNTEEGKKNLKLFFEDLGRDFTLTDLLYIVADKIIQDKHIYVTRYPIDRYQSIFASKVFILSTKKTIQQKIGDKYFESYPNVYLDYPVKDNPFIDTVTMSNSILDTIGGDYDGDMISLRGVYSQEANLEAEKIIYSKKHILDGTGRNGRVMLKEAISAIYTLTKD
jgi:DNA-directed RNA polymerase beta' subunit